MLSQVPLLKQWNERWGDYPYAYSTLATSGCAPTCFTMIAQFYGINITPPEAADFAIIHSFYPTPNGTSRDFFAAAGQYFGIPIHQTENPDEVRASLRQGIPCIGSHGPGEFTNYEHFIVYAHINANNEAMVNDPKRDDTCKLYQWDSLVQDNQNNGYVAFIPAPKISTRHS